MESNIQNTSLVTTTCPISRYGNYFVNKNNFMIGYCIWSRKQRL